ncbi:MAG: hypothetical protein Q8O24_06140 [Gallionellaceae bacterium]|nr:hypothetical protein [Gallionellaceae bacterium]
MAKKTYAVQSPIKHDGKDYTVGDSIDLDDKEAKDLLAVNALSDAVGLASNIPTVPTDPAERLAAIVAAIGKLSPEDASLWLKDKRPDAAAISVITGWPVSAAERNDAWASMQAAA